MNLLLQTSLLMHSITLTTSYSIMTRKKSKSRWLKFLHPNLFQSNRFRRAKSSKRTRKKRQKPFWANRLSRRKYDSQSKRKSWVKNRRTMVIIRRKNYLVVMARLQTKSRTCSSKKSKKRQKRSWPPQECKKKAHLPEQDTRLILMTLSLTMKN